MSEKKLQEYFIKRCKKEGVLAVKLESTSRRGWPDVIAIAPGGVITFIEFKNPNGKGRLSAHQKKTIDELTALGARVLVIDSREGVDAVLDPIYPLEQTA